MPPQPTTFREAATQRRWVVVGMLIGPPAIIGLSVHGNPLPWWAAVYSGQVVLAAIVGIALSVRRRLATPKRNPLAERIVGVI